MEIYIEGKFVFMNNEKGFIFPFTLFIITIILLTISLNISSYQYDIKLSKKALEQTEIESLFQMARTSLRNEDIDSFTTDTIKEYSFPNGTVLTIINKIEDDNVHITFDIITKNDSKSIIRYVMVKNDTTQLPSLE